MLFCSCRWSLLPGLLCLIVFGGCTKFDVLNATVPRCGFVRSTDIRYGPERRQSLDVYTPRNAVANTPVVIFIYGGYWITGEKGNYLFAAQGLASRGFIAVLPDYRLSPQVTFPGFVEDGALAIRWTHDHIAEFGGDPKRIYLMGHSAGGHIVAMLTLNPRYLQAVGLDRSVIRATAGLSGPYDFDPPNVSREAFNLKPGDKTPDPQIQPINFVDGHEPPMLLVTGSSDDIVEPGNAQRLANRIRAKGGEVRHLVYRGVGHVGTVLSLAYPFRWITSVLDDAAAFFRSH